MAKTKIHGEYLDPSVISGQTQVTAVGADSMLIFDATDNALKKALLSDVIETVGSTPTFSQISATSDLTLDVGGDIILDAAGDNWLFKKSGTTLLNIQKDSNNVEFISSISDGDMKFRGNDGGSTITALTLDMSNAGRATFNENVIVGGNLEVNGADVTITSNIIHAGDTNTYFGFNDADTFRIVTGGSEALRVNSSQQVGIGTSPTETLDVRGGAGAGTHTHAIFTGTAGRGLALKSGQTGGQHNGKAIIDAQDTETGGASMDFQIGGNTKVAIDNDGDVSISNDGQIPHASSKLHIKGSAFTMSDANGNAGGGVQIFNISKSAANTAVSVFKVQRDHGAHSGIAIVTKSNSGDSVAKIFAWAACYNSSSADIQTLASNVSGYTDFTASATVSNDEFTFKLTNGDSNSRSFRVTVIYGGAATLGTPTLY